MPLPTLTAESYQSNGFAYITTDTYIGGTLQAYIDDFQRVSFEKAIGVTVTDTIINTDPLPQKLIDLIEGVVYFDRFSTDKVRKKRFVGVDFAVIREIYFQWIRNKVTSTNTGLVFMDWENSERPDNSVINTDAIDRYNQGWSIFGKGLNDFIKNYTDYESIITNITDLGGGVFQIETTDTVYLSNSDSVRISGIDYIVSGIVDNTSFEVQNLQDLSATKFLYSPYEEVDICNDNYRVIV